MKKILLFHGCMNRLITAQISKATEKILLDAKVDYINLKNEQCCGFILYENGQQEAAIKLMKTNQEIFSGQDIDTILTSCPTCAYIFKVHYPENLSNFNYNVVHVTELLTKLIEEKRIDVHKKKDVTVTFHDPCHLLRGLKITEEPRKILNAILDQEFIEMEHTRDASKCCGAGSGMRLSFSRIAQTLAQDRISEAENTGATVLVTSCPTCMLHLQENARNIKVIDITGAILDL
ncbi:MAG: (Fe-S)-binding protein [Candidatus Hodarchaeota archaeon]